MYAANRKLEPDRRAQRWIKFTTYFFVTTTVTTLATLGPVVFSHVALAVLLIGAYELYTVLGFDKASFSAAVWACYALLGTALIVFSRSAAPAHVLFVYMVVAVFDGFSQIFGQLFGRHPLARVISPSKTIEGALGGALAATVSALLFRHLIDLSWGRAVVICATIVALALAGDLAASWIKRSRGVKDFGRLLPGHGGVLDRFDSFLLAAPVALLLLR